MENLHKLKGLSDDEITEEAMLRSRIDQQSELICILKQRSDEYLTKYMEKEKELDELKADAKKLSVSVREEKRSHLLVLDRFNTLDQNHNEMIKLKDEYKLQNEELRQENERLMKENQSLFSEAIRQRDNTISELRNEICGCQKRYSDALEQTRSLHAQLEQSRNEASEMVLELERKREAEDKKSKELLDQLTAESSSLKRDLSQSQGKLFEIEQQRKALEEKSEMQQQILNERNSRLETIQKELEAEQNRAKELEMKFKRESNAVSVNSQIKQLKEELKEMEEINEILTRDFEAYKKHSINLLNKERELNAKLRRLNMK